MRSRLLRKSCLQPASYSTMDRAISATESRGIHHAQDGQERRSRVPQQAVSITPLVRVDVAAVPTAGGFPSLYQGERPRNNSMPRWV